MEENIGFAQRQNDREREKAYLSTCNKDYLWSTSCFLTRTLSKLVKSCEFSHQGLDYALYRSLKTSVQTALLLEQLQDPCGSEELF